MKMPSVAGFGRKLLLFVFVDVIMAGVQISWEKRAPTEIILLVILRLPYSVILALLWNAIDKR
jgi:hypothetical protein